MTERKDEETRATAQGLTAALNDMAAEVKRLRTYGRRNRTYIVFDVLLTVALGVSSFVAVHASQSAHDAQTAAAAARAAVQVAEQDNRNLCLSSNVARAQSIELWDYLLALPAAKGTPPPSAQQKKRVAEFRAFLDKVYAARDCTHVSPGNP